MNAALDLDAMKRRAFSDVNRDGLLEMMMGIVFGLGALVAVRPAMIIFLFLIAAFLPRVILALRKRVTFPRIGEAKLVEDTSPRTVWGPLIVFVLGLVALALGLIFFGDVRDPRLWQRWVPAVIGTVMACAFWYIASISGRVQYVLLAVLLCVSGLLFPLLNFEGYAGISLYVGCVGGFLFLFGLLMLIRFVVTHPVVDETAFECE